MDGRWRTDALNLTVNEVPKLMETGTEIGPNLLIQPPEYIVLHRPEKQAKLVQERP